MRYIELEGKKYKLKGRFGKITKLLKKYDLLKLTNGGWGDDEKTYIDFVLESTWKLIEPQGFFKPYIFFWRFKRLVVFDEIMSAQKSVLGILYGLPEDKEPDIEEELKEKKSQKMKAS